MLAPITAKKTEKSYPFEALIEASATGLPQRSKVLLMQLRALDKRRIVGQHRTSRCPNARKSRNGPTNRHRPDTILVTAHPVIQGYPRRRNHQGSRPRITARALRPLTSPASAMRISAGSPLAGSYWSSTASGRAWRSKSGCSSSRLKARNGARIYRFR